MIKIQVGKIDPASAPIDATSVKGQQATMMDAFKTVAKDGEPQQPKRIS